MDKKVLFGYGAATFADSAPYNFVTVYLILFLTTVAGVSPEMAGTIFSVTVLAEGAVGAVIGYISDNIRWKHGRRRPFLLAAILPLGAGLVLMFSSVDAQPVIQVVFYVLVGLMFWLGFSVYYTPYTALGAELTDDYHERSILRTIARLFGIVANFIGMVVPLIFVQYAGRHGISDKSAWFMIAAIIAVLSGVSIFVTWKATRGREISAPEAGHKMNLKNLFNEYTQVVKLRVFKYMIAVVGMFIIANTFYNTSMVFFARYQLGLDDSVTSSIFMVSIVTNLVLTPVMGLVAVKTGKKATLGISMLMPGIAAVIMFVTGIDSYFQMCMFAVIYTIAYTCFWQLINAIMYDITEVGEFLLGKRLEGSISSMFCVICTVFSSAASQMVGWLIKFGWINLAFILLPGICLIIAAVAQFMYPINEKRFNKLKDALRCRKNGGEPDLTGLEKLF